MIPQEDVPRGVSKKPSKRRIRSADNDGNKRSAPNTSNPLYNYVYQMLRRQGQPNGTLTIVSASESELKFRWQVPLDLLRPCMTAQIWRPSQAGHKSNGAWVSVDSHGGVYLICLHPRCLQRGYCNRRLLGQAPLSLLDQFYVSRTTYDPRADGAGNDRENQQPNLAGNTPQHSPGPRNRNEHIWRKDCPTEDPSTSAHLSDDTGSVAWDGIDEEPNEANTPLASLPVRHHRKLSRGQSIRCVEIENQQAKSESFQPWTVETGPWGRRTSGAPEMVKPNSNTPSGPADTLESTLQAWVETSEISPFSQHPPHSLLHSVQNLLVQDNAHHAKGNVQARLHVGSNNTRLPPPHSQDLLTASLAQGWSVGPEHDWLQAPIVSRLSVGRDLLDRAALEMRRGNSDSLNCPFRMDTWSSPFTVGYLNVGRRHLVGSLSDVVEMVLRHRPDILFLGDLVTSRDHIGRLKKQLESDLHDEWFVTTNISTQPGRPVGVGAIVHCSLARHMTDCVIPYPEANGSETDKQEWIGAVDGRIQCIKITRPGSPLTWQFVGVYQHVAASGKRAARAIVRNTLSDVVERATKEGHRVALLGDFNAAPLGGRWGYSKWSAAVREDKAMTDWLQAINLIEILHQGKPTPTWKPSEGPQEATLDRVFVTHEAPASLELSVQWCNQLTFDHALLTLRIQHSQIGTGYAGACRPDRDTHPQSRCRVNLRKWRKHVPEWSRLVHEGLSAMSAENQDNPLDPFEALKRGELLADSVAQALAPKYVRRPGDKRRAFGFAGNRLLFRELNLLRKARSIVYKVFTGDSTILHCPHRLLRWTLATHDLHLKVRRSGHAVPEPLVGAPHGYFTLEARRQLQAWLGNLNVTIASRQAAVRESYEKARYYNLQNLRKKRKEANGVLDKRTIQAALGKCQPRQRMWGVSGKVVLGVTLDVPVEQQLQLLYFLKESPDAENMVHLAGNKRGLSIWFSGPRQAGDFIVHWSSGTFPGGNVPICPLQPPGQYVAIRPDDMLSVQECYMASEGMDTYSVCPDCRKKGLHVLSTSATHQAYGNPTRAIRFFCEQCQMVYDAPALGPMPPCPIPKQVMEAMRRIPTGTPPLISRPIDFETFEKCTMQQPNDRAPGSDGQPREFSKYGPTSLRVLYWRAGNAYMRGETPTVCPHEWAGAVAGYIPKNLSALLMPEFRPVACICTKFVLVLSITDKRMDHTTEDYKLIEDAQEGFRRGRSTKRQLGKLHNILTEQRRRKDSLSVILYLDIKNAFNAVNHRAVFFILEAKGFPEEDLAFFRRMYTGSFLVMVNHFGRSAACVLSRGMPQGSPPSPRVFNTTYDPFNAIIRHCRRGCTLQGLIDPTGSDVFADDSTLHTDGPDAIAALALMAPKGVSYLEWAGMEIHLKKCGITAMDMRTGQQVATDSVTLRGEAFPVIPPNQSHKHLGLRMAINGDFSAEKLHVRTEMQQRLKALAEDRVLSRTEKELVIKTAVCSVFRYSAGFVDWTKSELDSISKLWIRAYKQAWTLPGSTDSSPIILDQAEGGRGCPSAVDLWTREVFEVMEQCVCLPGDISRITIHCLQQQCIAHGCYALNQLQLLLRLRGNAETVLERFLLRLDEQGLEISSPWASGTEQSLLETLWPRLHKAWLEKERWAGCREVADEVRMEWDQAQQCLKACGKLGNAEPAILSAAHLSGDQHQWMSVAELQHRKCQLTAPDYTALTSWLSLGGGKEMEVGTALKEVGDYRQLSNLRMPTSSERECREERGSPEDPGRYGRMPQATDCAAKVSIQIPPCIRGQVVGTELHAQLVLRDLLPEGLPERYISDISDQMLADHLCQARAVFPFQRCDNDTTLVECLTPLRTVTPYRSQLEYIIVRPFADEDAPITVMQVALVRDCLMGADRERLADACGRPCWTVTEEEYYADHCFSALSGDGPLTWKLQTGNSTDQTTLTGLVQYISQRRSGVGLRLISPPQPWQADPPLPSRIIIDVSHHHPKSLPAPEGWEVIQRNGRVWISERNNRVAKMDAAQYHMLSATCCHLDAQAPPTEQSLTHICASCRAQNDADQEFFVHWSRHLLASIQQITGCELLIGASAVTYNPHFPHFSSPYSPDVHLGAIADWPQVPALLIIDSFTPQLRHQLLAQATSHDSVIWVLRQHKGNPDDPDLVVLRKIARLYAELPKKSLAVHRMACWETAEWDVEPSRYTTQLWRLDTPAGLPQSDPELLPAIVQQHLTRGGRQSYAFHWSDGVVPPRLLLYRQHQQDALRHSWDGLVAGTDGSVDEGTERMGAGYVLGDDPEPIWIFSASVGGPLATVRAEAASLLQLLRDVRMRKGHQVNLLIFVDCLVVLDILRKWGRADFHPGPKEVVHFDVIRQLLQELRQWSGNVTLVKVKSHTGCLMNERADEQAELGRMAEGPDICPGPQKYGSFWLRVRPAVRELAGSSGKPLPRDSAPNRSLLEKTAASNTLRAVKKRSTVFVTDLLHHKEGATVSKVIRRCTPAVYRIWLKCMTGTYPVQAHLKRIGIAKSPICPHCSQAVPESLTHFACVCPKFREARTSAHNQVRDVITSFLGNTVGPNWTMHEETPMAKTGLVLRPTALATVAQLGRRQPDWVLVSSEHKRIAIVDLCRPSDVLPSQLLVAAKRKQHTYCPLVEALSYYTEQGWITHIFPWVVGIRGMIDPVHVESLLKFLGVQRKHWRTAVERSVLASARAFHFLHKVRFGGLSDARRADPDPDNSDSEKDEDEEEAVTKRKSRGRDTNAAQDSADSDSSACSSVQPSPSRQTTRRARRTLPTREVIVEADRARPISSPHTSAKVGRRTHRPGSKYRGPVPTPGLGAARQHTGWQRPYKRHGKAARPTTDAMPVDVLNPRGETRNMAKRQIPKRKRWECTNTRHALDIGDPDHQPTKQHQCAMDDHPEVPWKRWRQLEPQWRRRI